MKINILIEEAWAKYSPIADVATFNSVHRFGGVNGEMVSTDSATIIKVKRKRGVLVRSVRDLTARLNQDGIPARMGGKTDEFASIICERPMAELLAVLTRGK